MPEEYLVLYIAGLLTHCTKKLTVAGTVFAAVQAEVLIYFTLKGTGAAGVSETVFS